MKYAVAAFLLVVAVLVIAANTGALRYLVGLLG
jgi:hypothetical protein